MAFKLGDSDDPVMSDINVTPLVDVMLVLLIIFMIAAPMLHQGIDVSLPRTEAPNLAVRQENPLVLSIRKDGMVFLDQRPIHDSQLAERLEPLLESRQDRFVFLKGDESVPYGRVMEVLDILRRGGIENVGMVTENGRRKGARRSP